MVVGMTRSKRIESDGVESIRPIDRALFAVQRDGEQIPTARSMIVRPQLARDLAPLQAVAGQPRLDAQPGALDRLGRAREIIG
jgi:hypothetical protein